MNIFSTALVLVGLISTDVAWADPVVELRSESTLADPMDAPAVGMYKINGSFKLEDLLEWMTVLWKQPFQSDSPSPGQSFEFRCDEQVPSAVAYDFFLHAFERAGLTIERDDARWVVRQREAGPGPERVILTCIRPVNGHPEQNAESASAAETEGGWIGVYNATGFLALVGTPMEVKAMEDAAAIGAEWSNITDGEPIPGSVHRIDGPDDALLFDYLPVILGESALTVSKAPPGVQARVRVVVSAEATIGEMNDFLSRNHVLITSHQGGTEYVYIGVTDSKYIDWWRLFLSAEKEVIFRDVGLELMSGSGLETENPIHGIEDGR